jgi:hypothetical protein
MNPIVRIISAIFIYSIKIFSLIFYRTEAHWITPKKDIKWDKVRLVVILNHTSLFEPLFISIIPNLRIWRAIKLVVVPIADVTMNRPIVGKLFKIFVPNCIPITRKRDDSWDKFMSHTSKKSISLLFPEGRMKRIDGLDKHGNPMSVKGGVADILSELEKGKLLIAYSGGLHHVQSPGQKIPNIFQKIKITMEELDIKEYKNDHTAENHPEFRKNIINDLEERMKKYC